MTFKIPENYIGSTEIGDDPSGVAKLIGKDDVIPMILAGSQEPIYLNDPAKGKFQGINRGKWEAIQIDDKKSQKLENRPSSSQS